MNIIQIILLSLVVSYSVISIVFIAYLWNNIELAEKCIEEYAGKWSMTLMTLLLLTLIAIII
jgi:hypothetical protein